MSLIKKALDKAEKEREMRRTGGEGAGSGAAKVTGEDTRQEDATGSAGMFESASTFWILAILVLSTVIGAQIVVLLLMFF